MESWNNEGPKSKRAMEEELIRGRDMANQLLEVVLAHAHAHAHGEGDKEGSLAEDLVREVLSSFTNTLLLLNSNNHHLPPITINHVSSFTNCPKLQIKDETCKTNNTKSRRRCYNRKSVAPTWERDSSIQVEDGYGWRKYGQKMTSNAKYLRSYYRCTHKSDEGCQAIKQVQRIQEKPPLYRTTYYGHHSCKNNLNPEITLQPVSPSSSSSVILNFNSPFSSSLLAPTKQEPVEVIHNDHAQTQVPTLDNDHLLYDYDFCNFDCSKHVTMLSSAESVEFNNVYEHFGF